MIINTSKSKIYIKEYYKSSQTPYFFIHGFTGSSLCWEDVIHKLKIHSFAIDIPGHGKSEFKSLDEEYNFNDFSNDIYMVLLELQIKGINLCGYSMGGRLALKFASAYPNKIKSLILESTSYGLSYGNIRSERILEDNLLSKMIIEDFESFVDQWENNKLFSKQKNRNKQGWQKQRDIRLSHNKLQLAKSIDSLSLGIMPFLEEQYKQVECPIVLINGTEDDKFIKLGKNMLYSNLKAKQYIVEKACHNIHLENTEMFTDLLQEIYCE